MSDPVIQSQLQNPLLRSLRESFTSNLSYNTTENYPSVSKQLTAISSNIAVPSSVAWPASQEIVFNIPKNGFMDSLMIQTSFTAEESSAGVATLVRKHAGEYIFERIELLAQNRVIAVQSLASLHTHIAGLSPAQQMAIRNRTALKNAGTLNDYEIDETAASAVTYTPFFNGLLGNIRSAIDLTKVQDLQIRAYVRPSQDIWSVTSPATTTLSNFKFTLFMNSHVIDQEKYLELRQQNFKENSTLNIINYDYYTEEFDVIAPGDHQLQLRCNGAVSETAVYVSSSTGESKPFRVSFRANGMTLLESIPGDMMQFEGDYHGAGLEAIKSYSTTGGRGVHELQDSTVTKIHWGLAPGSIYNSGLINFKGLSNPTLVIPTSGAAKIYVVHKIFTIVTISSDGSIHLTSTV